MGFGGHTSTFHHFSWRSTIACFSANSCSPACGCKLAADCRRACAGTGHIPSFGGLASSPVVAVSMARIRIVTNDTICIPGRKAPGIPIFTCCQGGRGPPPQCPNVCPLDTCYTKSRLINDRLAASIYSADGRHEKGWWMAVRIAHEFSAQGMADQVSPVQLRYSRQA